MSSFGSNAEHLEQLEKRLDERGSGTSAPIPIRSTAGGTGTFSSGRSQLGGWSPGNVLADANFEPGSIGARGESLEGSYFSGFASFPGMASPPKQFSPIQPTLVQPSGLSPIKTENKAAVSSALPPRVGKEVHDFAEKEKKQENRDKGSSSVPFEKPEKKKLTKAERREIQERQRAEKSRRLGKTDGRGEGSERGAVGDDSERSVKKGKAKPNVPLQFDNQKKLAKAAKKQIIPRTQSQKQVPLFSHLPQYEREGSYTEQLGFASNSVIHPITIRAGLQMAEGHIMGTNARVVSLLTALKFTIEDTVCPADVAVSRYLSTVLSPQIQFMVDCRPLSPAMGNAINALKYAIMHTPSEATDAEAKSLATNFIDTFIKERIHLADIVIASSGASKIENGDVILIHARSHVVEMLLRVAHDEGKRFKVVIVDSRPLLEGKHLLRRLAQYGITCTYVLMNALSYVMKDISKVVLGAAAMMQNGSVLSRAGTSMVAMMAQQYNKPVLVACETYKFTERALLDSFCYNSLGNPDDLAHTGSNVETLKGWREVPALKLLNLHYDVTPREMVTVVVTERGKFLI
mmetsp:Transcript_9125/g.24764  ORF Transcript_9125/g.24764 Transcript_9125/m.24764 type:complete len:575 (-) Transcript_9125:199-1923(-)